jgi:hypothetical protein
MIAVMESPQASQLFEKTGIAMPLAWKFLELIHESGAKQGEASAALAAAQALLPLLELPSHVIGG